MKLSQLSSTVREKIKSYNWDGILGKHEGPESWEFILEHDNPELMEIDGHHVLLPIGKKYHPNITILRSIPSVDCNTLTLFLKDTTYVDDMFESGFLAVCDRFPGENFFLAIVYHEWFIFENP